MKPKDDAVGTNLKGEKSWRWTKRERLYSDLLQPIMCNYVRIITVTCFSLTFDCVLSSKPHNSNNINIITNYVYIITNFLYIMRSYHISSTLGCNDLRA